VVGTTAALLVQELAADQLAADVVQADANLDEDALRQPGIADLMW